MNDNQITTNPVEKEETKIQYKSVVKLNSDTTDDICSRLSDETTYQFEKMRKNMIRTQILEKSNSLAHSINFVIKNITTEDKNLDKICRNFNDDCLYGDPTESAVMITFLDKALSYIRNSEVYPEYSALVNLNYFKIAGMNPSEFLHLDITPEEGLLSCNAFSETPDLSKIANHVFTMLSIIISKDYNTWDLLYDRKLPDWVLNFKRCEPHTTNFIWEERDDDSLSFEDIGIFNVLITIKKSIDDIVLYEDPIQFDSYSIYDLMIVASYIEAIIIHAIRVSQIINLNVLWKYPDWILDFIYNSYSYVRVDEYILRGGCLDNIIEWICSLPINDTVNSSINSSRCAIMKEGIPYPYLYTPSLDRYGTNCIAPGAMAYSTATSIPGSFLYSPPGTPYTGDTSNNKKKRTSRSKR